MHANWPSRQGQRRVPSPRQPGQRIRRWLLAEITRPMPPHSRQRIWAVPPHTGQVWRRSPQHAAQRESWRDSSGKVSASICHGSRPDTARGSASRRDRLALGNRRISIRRVSPQARPNTSSRGVSSTPVTIDRKSARRSPNGRAQAAAASRPRRRGSEGGGSSPGKWRLPAGQGSPTQGKTRSIDFWLSGARPCSFPHAFTCR